MNSKLKLIGKIVLVVGFLWLMVQKGFISMEATGRAFTRLDLLIPAFLVAGICSVLGAWRWQILLHAQGMHLPFRRTLQLTFVGIFFNVVIPGAVSGDVVKALYIGKEMPGLRSAAFGSILLDRLIGVSALVIVSALGVVLGYRRLQGTPVLSGVQFLVTLSAGIAIAFYLYLFLVKEGHDPLLILLRKLSTRHPRVGSLQRIYEGVRHYHHRRAAVLGSIAISLAIHLMIGWTCLQYAYALGEEHLFLLGLYVVVPLGLLVTAVPIAPAGVGTGHAAFAYLFHLIDSARGADVFSLTALANLLLGAIGALVYLAFKHQGLLPPTDTANAAEISAT